MSWARTPKWIRGKPKPRRISWRYCTGTSSRQLERRAGLKKCLQDQDCGHAVHGLGALTAADFSIAQQPVGFGRSEPLIPEMDGKLELLPQFLGKLRYFLRLSTFLPAHTQGITYNNFAHLI